MPVAKHLSIYLASHSHCFSLSCTKRLGYSCNRKNNSDASLDACYHVEMFSKGDVGKEAEREGTTMHSGMSDAPV